MRGKTIEILQDAMKGGYAVGAFNTSNLELTQAIVRAAKEEGPCVVQVTTSGFKYANANVMGALIENVVKYESESAKIGFHLDHGKSFDDIVSAIEAGADSVMIDASIKSFEDNIKVTKQVVDYAHKFGVTVQAELGAVPYLGREDQEIDWDSVMTNPVQAKELVERTGIDALAVGIGNAHGFFKERDVPDWDRLAEIRRLLPDTPLIMHGASDWEAENVKKAIKGGICCFNVDTDIRIAFISTICHETEGSCDVSDPRKLLGLARDKVQLVVQDKIRMFAGK